MKPQRLVIVALCAAIIATATVAADRPVLAQAAASEGATLAFDRGKGNCLSCHKMTGADLPGTIGPPLSEMKSRFPDRAELTAIVVDETARNPQTVMPPFGRNLILSDKEISAIVDFLYTL